MSTGSKTDLLDKAEAFSTSGKTELRRKNPTCSTAAGERSAICETALQTARICDPMVGLMLEQSAPEGLHLGEGTHTGADQENEQPMGRTHIGDHEVRFPLEEEKKLKATGQKTSQVAVSGSMEILQRIPFQIKPSRECVKSGTFGHQAGIGADAWQEVSIDI
ncbi:hypothetical protein HGM15179_007864 [Zosterops borbonicus]|uniref:Uncharacterized protein n=1 Tax=Zosterops borbonicus TaxID=364589 RepID=A0A8K1GHW8_9PASS|nr:hypothetical protein HGM15179_007864 [Zosterops borbonicus]